MLRLTDMIDLAHEIKAQKEITESAFSVIGPQCEIKKHIRIDKATAGSFNPSGLKLAFDKMETIGSTTNQQLYTANRDGTEMFSLTAVKVPGGPEVDTHKWNPSWHKSGKFIAVQVERVDGGLRFMRNTKLGYHLAMNGLDHELWVTNPAGLKWWKLYSPPDDNHDFVTGVMMPTFSRDGRKIGWSRLIRKATDLEPNAAYKIEVADFVVTDGVPSIKNIRDVSPDNHKILEIGGFNADNTKLIIGADLESTNMQIYELDIATRAARRLTNNTVWDEHPTYTLDYKKFVYLHKNELFIAATDGSSNEQLSYFNDWAKSTWRSAQSEWPVIPTTTEWNPDGTKLACTVQSIFNYPYTALEIVTFDGVCG